MTRKLSPGEHQLPRLVAFLANPHSTIIITVSMPNACCWPGADSRATRVTAGEPGAHPLADGFGWTGKRQCAKPLSRRGLAVAGVTGRPQKHPKPGVQLEDGGGEMSGGLNGVLRAWMSRTAALSLPVWSGKLSLLPLGLIPAEHGGVLPGCRNFLRKLGNSLPTGGNTAVSLSLRHNSSLLLS